MSNITLHFEDGGFTIIPLEKVIEVNTKNPNRREISFRETDNGWVMAITKSLLTEKLANNFITGQK